MNRRESRDRVRRSSYRTETELNEMADEVVAKRTELRKKAMELLDFAEDYFNAFDELEKAETEYADDYDEDE